MARRLGKKTRGHQQMKVNDRGLGVVRGNFDHILHNLVSFLQTIFGVTYLPKTPNERPVNGCEPLQSHVPGFFAAWYLPVMSSKTISLLWVLTWPAIAVSSEILTAG